MRSSLKTDHLEICKLILGKIDIKNPADNEGWTPLHLAAFNGHLDFCQMIIEQIDYNHLTNNDKTEEEWTPLHWAVHKGHEDVCRLIITKANIMNPIFENGNTLLEFAVANPTYRYSGFSFNPFPVIVLVRNHATQIFL